MRWPHGDLSHRQTILWHYLEGILGGYHYVQNNVVINTSPPPKRDVTPPSAAGKSPISSAIGQAGECWCLMCSQPKIHRCM